MSFQFSLGRAQVKHFKTALQTLNRIGGELLVETVPDQLVLRSINTAKSAFLCVTYFSRFFDSYEIYDTAVVQTVVLSKNVLVIFRSQKISQIQFTLDNAAARLQATVHTDEGLVKRYAFNCLDGEVLQATVEREAYPTVVVAEALELEKLLSSFQHTLDEITLIANPLSAAVLSNGHKACEMRSFVDPLKGGLESALLTSLTLDTRSVFTSYSHTAAAAADVTFNVKDFRAMTALCTALGADVALRLEAAGAPLLVEPHFRGLREGAETDFQAMLVLSTLTDSQLGPEHQQQQPAYEGDPQQEGQQQAHMQQQQPQPWPPETAAEPPSPYDDGGGAAATGSGEVQERPAAGGRGRGRAAIRNGAAATAAPGGRVRRRLPRRLDDSAAGAAATARGAYAAAAAAEGLPPGAGAGAAAAAAEADVPTRRPTPGASGWPEDTGAAAGDVFRDGYEDDPPARRIGRPPRYDPINHAADAADAVPFVNGADGMGGGGASFLHPLPKNSLQAARGPNAQQQQPDQQVLQRPADPRAGSAHGTTGRQQQQRYLQFPRDTGLAGPRPGDSQDPEILPGVRQGHDQGQGHAAARSPSYGSYSASDPRVATQAAAGHEPGPAVARPLWDAVAAGAPLVGGGGGGVGPPSPPGPHGQPAGKYQQPYAYPHAAEGLLKQQQEQRPQEQGQELRPIVVDHADLFGEDDDGAGAGGYEDGGYEDDDDDEEVPATPPDQQQKRSMGAGVLGVGEGSAGGQEE